MHYKFVIFADFLRDFDDYGLNIDYSLTHIIIKYYLYRITADIYKFRIAYLQ